MPWAAVGKTREYIMMDDTEQSELDSLVLDTKLCGPECSFYGMSRLRTEIPEQVYARIIHLCSLLGNVESSKHVDEFGNFR